MDEQSATAHLIVNYGGRKPYVRCKTPEAANLVDAGRAYPCWRLRDALPD
ncbi:hypothetical protein [Nocardia sp. NPDC049149]